MSSISSVDLNLIQSMREKLLDWFALYGRDFPWRHHDANNYEKIISEILLQRTKAEAVDSAYRTFFKKFPDWNSLNEGSIESVQESLKHLGLWRRRATTLKLLAESMIKSSGIFPSKRSDINDLPGVGQYVGNAIELFVHERPKPLLDTNMARVIERIFHSRKLADIRYDPWLQATANELVKSTRAIEVNWAVLDLGATICKPKSPECPSCPLSLICNHKLSLDKKAINVFS